MYQDSHRCNLAFFVLDLSRYPSYSFVSRAALCLDQGFDARELSLLCFHLALLFSVLPRLSVHGVGWTCNGGCLERRDVMLVVPIMLFSFFSRLAASFPQKDVLLAFSRFCCQDFAFPLLLAVSYHFLALFRIYISPDGVTASFRFLAEATHGRGGGGVCYMGID